MAFIDLVSDDADKPAEVEAVFAAAREGYGFVPNVLRALAHCPDLLTTFAPFWAQVYRSPTIGGRLRALSALGTAQAQSCTYCVAHMSASARRVGMSEQEVSAVGDPHVEQRVFHDERETLVLEVAAALTRDPDGVTDDLRARLRRHLTDAEIVNVVVAIGLYNLTSRFLKALDVEVEDVFTATPTTGR
ncbi:peroxidase-related enzyme [Saccharothrix violaceirubra]|uniref:Putative peroxidase-related enzyme n=1 Tax=Saccharothrix violaceirubra TaxID=413306 RepID=A0A7W7T2M4_9PSEU|nr:carboxymuconolactone decarboxylase family protein [Saccharothrix violaceirubra]MBB4965096.1 putative peroxidase-related enzyme [Saccharothrix violaceirubra]